MAELKIVAVEYIAPPSQLGESVILVPINETIQINKSNLMSSIPEYEQEDGYPIGGIKITGYGYDLNNLTPPSGNGLIANLLNNTSQIRYQEGDFINNEILNTDLSSGNFKVKGNSVGMDYIQYVSKSVSPITSKESEYSSIMGKILIKVIDPSEINHPPDQVGNNEIECFIGGYIIIKPPVFTTQTIPTYSDPENDPPKDVKITNNGGVSGGSLMFNGKTIAIGSTITCTLDDLELGKLRFYFDNTVSEGQEYILNFGVSDTGSLQFTF